MSRGMAARVRELSAERVPFVHATVVRAQVPSSAKAGDDAVVLPDGTIEGFVGGQCAETSVRTSTPSDFTAAVATAEDSGSSTASSRGERSTIVTSQPVRCSANPAASPPTPAPITTARAIAR